MTRSGERRRVFWIDWLRVLAILMVFFFHCMHFFDYIDWHVKNDDQSLTITALIVFVAGWIMPLFFALSGSAAALALPNGSFVSFIRSRARRLLVPYLVAVAFLIPPQKYLEALHYDLFDGSFWSFIGQYSSFLGRGIGGWANASPTPRLFGYVGYHAWFLAFLFLYFIVSVPIFHWMSSGSGRRWIDELARYSMARPSSLLLGIVPVAVINLSLRAAFPDYLDWADTVYFLVFFIAGFVLLLDRRFSIALARGWRLWLSLGVIGSSLILSAGLFTEYLRRWMESPSYSIDYLGYQAVASVATCGWVLFFLGAGIRWLDVSKPMLSRLNEAVLPFYLLHQTVILVIGFPIVRLEWPIAPKLVLITASSLVATVALYEGPVRRIELLRVLFGLKPSRISTNIDRPGVVVAPRTDHFAEVPESD